MTVPAATGAGSVRHGSAARACRPGRAAEPRAPFHVRLDNFDGPFDLLLQLISQHRMDVTEVALHQVTDDFIAHIRADGRELGPGPGHRVPGHRRHPAGPQGRPAAARRRPPTIAADAEQLPRRGTCCSPGCWPTARTSRSPALFAELEAGALRRYPRAVTLEPRYLGLLPEVQHRADAAAVRRTGGAGVRGRSRRRRSTSTTSTPRRCRCAEHTEVLRALLPPRGAATFGELVAGCTATLEVVARFLGLLHLYRESAVAFDQAAPLGTLTVRWIRRRRSVGRRRGCADRRGVRMSGDPDRGRDRRRRPRLERPGARRESAELRRRTTAGPTVPDARPGRRAGGGAAGRRRARSPSRRWPRRSVTGRPGARRSCSRWPPGTPRRRPGSSCARSAAAGGSTPGTGSRRSSSGSCWTARQAGCPRRRWRRSRSSPTGSRSPAPGSRPSAASTSTAWSAR